MSAAPGTRGPQQRTPISPPAGLWTAVPEASEARFSVRDKLVTTVHGTLPVEDGGIVVSDTGSVMQAWLTVSLRGIATGNARRDADLLKARFLDAERFPTVHITVDTATLTPDGCTASGTVLARGVQVPINLVAVLVEQPAGAAQLRLGVTGTLDRRPLAIQAPTFIIGRYVHLDADLVFRRTSDTGPAARNGDAG